MTEQQLHKIISDHKLWRDNRGWSRADLSGADLPGVDLFGVDLPGAILSKADLSGAVLARAILTRADLTRAILTRADLTGAILTGAVLTRADLSEAQYNLLNMMQLFVRNPSNNLTLELMRWDATICGYDNMQKWAKRGNCPFSSNIQRLFYFQERRDLWKPGSPTKSLLELWQWIAREHNIKI